MHPATTFCIQALVDRLVLADQEQEMEAEQTIVTILTLSRQLQAHPGFSRGFVFDNGVPWGLVHVLALCKMTELRMEVVDVVRGRGVG